MMYRRGVFTALALLALVVVGAVLQVAVGGSTPTPSAAATPTATPTSTPTPTPTPTAAEQAGELLCEAFRSFGEQHAVLRALGAGDAGLDGGKIKR